MTERVDKRGRNLVLAVNRRGTTLRIASFWTRSQTQQQDDVRDARCEQCVAETVV